MRTLIVLSLFCCSSLLAEEIKGTVTSVHDGDSITVQVEKTKYKIRLTEIDAPELNQAYGVDSQRVLSTELLNQTVRVKINGQDRYGRKLGEVFLREQSVNLKQVQRGAAWRYVAYSKRASFREAEESARTQRLGLWGTDSPPEAPWVFRQRKGSRTP